VVSLEPSALSVPPISPFHFFATTELRTPEVQKTGERGSRGGPDTKVGRAHITNDARRMRVGVNERVRRRDLLGRHDVARECLENRYEEG
jgi:hypothetical protein